MTSLEFVITFYSPFRVGSTYARDGIDAALDRHDPLPGDHLKGLMLAAAVDILGKDVAKGVYGTPKTPCVWAWSSARPDGAGWAFDHRHRVAIDHETHTARKDHLVLGEQAYATTGRFTVARVGYLDPAAEEHHIRVLRVSASAVHGLGAWRRRGLGWVGIEPAMSPVSADEVTAVLALRAGAS